MTGRTLHFAVPGDPDTLTGGYIFDARVADALTHAGHDVRRLRLPDGFPDPDPDAMAAALAQLAAVPAGDVLVVDGLAFGALDPAGVARISAPIIALVHHPLALETGITPARAQHLAAFESANLARAARVIVPSPHIGAVLVRDYGVPTAAVTVASPGVDRPSGPCTPEMPPLILSVGSLSPRKGHDTLLRALALIDDLDWQATIVGGAQDAAAGADLADLCDALRLAGRVRFAGSLPEAALAARYRAASVFALATHYEGYGMVFAEALAHGLPIVSCAVGAVPGTVPAAAGVLVAPGDPGAFAAALRRMLTDARWRNACAAAARDHARTLPSWEDTAAVFARVMAEMQNA